MKQNMGSLDRILRTGAGAALLLGYFLGFLPGTLGLVFLGVAALLIGTSAVGFCPAYLPIRFSTKPKE